MSLPVMPQMGMPPTAWTTGYTDVIKTGTWRAALPEHRVRRSPCEAACPVNGDIARWIARAKAGDWRGAWDILVENSPFPAVAGRVCHQPCEASCNRSGLDEALAICSLERHVGERALAAGWRFAAAPLGTERVAVVGGGPSGLSAAYQLRRRGYAVTLYEAAPQLGGLMREGIPPYRLPREVLDGEIERIVAMGIEVHTRSPIFDAGKLERLRASCDAVYVAIGAGRPKRLAALDYAQPWVMEGSAYLAQANAGKPPALGERLVVIGGGSAAMDVARSARRAGHEVVVLSLESEPQMPAQREEVLAAREEGVVLLPGATLAQAVQRGSAIQLSCVAVAFTPSPFTVTPLSGTDFELEADAVVTAIGQDPDLAALAPLARTEGALLWTDAHGATSVPGVYAGGDVASMQRFVTHAIGMGKRAAIAMDQHLTGKAAPAQPDDLPVSLSAINTYYHPRAARLCGTRAELDADQALAEAARCFSCGHCTQCDNCLLYCPDLAVKRVDGGAGGYEIAGDYCKGCGLCVRECPTGAIAMREELR